MLLFILSESELRTALSHYFNTSHVTVYRVRLNIVKINSIFQYISCYCLSPVRFRAVALKTISIHLMLLFICKFHFLKTAGKWISIHLMLLFISTGLKSGNYQPIISIHLMLLFIMTLLIHLILSQNFNTSHVTVYPHKCQS